MEAQIAAVLRASMSPDEATRVGAEHQLTQGGTQPGFGLGLARVALGAAEDDVGTRQLAAVVLKKYVKEHWQEGEGRFFPPQTSDEEKAAVRELLPAGLADPTPKIRTAIAMAVASVAAWDWPHQWPTLTTVLIGAVREGRSEASVLGALRCLAMICRDLDEAQVPLVVPSLLPELHSLVAPDSVSRAVKRRALAVLHSCLLALGMMSGARQRATRDLLAPELPRFLDAFATVLSEVPDAADPDACGTTLETLRCVTQVAQYFAKPAGEALMRPLGCAASLFHRLAERYRALFVAHGADPDALLRGGADVADDDGEALTLETAASQLLELLMTLAEHPRLGANLEPGLGEIVHTCVGYMCMTGAQEETWTDDPEQYVADEDDDAASPRAVCVMLLDELCDRFGANALVALAGAVERRLASAETAKRANDPAWWKDREAAMLAVGSMGDHVLEAEAAASEANRAPPFPASAFLASVLATDLKPGGGGYGGANGGSNAAPGDAFLRGRALWVVSKLASGGAGAAHAGAALQAATEALRPDLDAPLRVGACRALAQFVPVAPKDALRPFLGPIYQGLGGLLERALGEPGGGDGGEASSGFGETLHLVLEAMLVVVKADAEAATAWAHALAPATLRAWAERISDPLLASDARDVLEALASYPACLPSLHAMSVPTLARIVSAPESQPPMLAEHALDLLAVLIRPCAPEQARACHAACFRAVCAVALTSDDAGCLQNAAECLRAMLRAGGEASLEWGADGAGGGGDVLRAYLDVAARLLSPALEDGAAVFAAPLLGQMLRRLPGKMAPLLPEMVAAVVARQRSARQPNLVAALLSVFARLAHADADALVDLLQRTPAPPLPADREPTDEDTGACGIPPPTTALELVARAWVGHQPDVQGAFDLKLTTSALAILLAAGHPALETVAVKGPPAIDDAARDANIRTRSRARAAGPERFRPTPLPGKMLELLADAVLEAREARGANGADDDDDDDDDDDEWEEEGGDGGGGGARGDADGGLASAFGEGGVLERLLARGEDAFEDDDADEADDPVGKLDVESFLAGKLRDMHAAGRLAPLAAGLSASRQQALGSVLQGAA